MLRSHPLYEAANTHNLLLLLPPDPRWRPRNLGAPVVFSRNFPRPRGCQVATGGLINPTTKTRVEVEEAVKIGWIDQKRANRLSDPSRSTRQIVSPTTGLLISYFDALMTSIPDKHNNLQLEALPKAERELRVGNAQIKAYSCASSVVSSIAASSFGDFSTPGQTVNMGFF